MINTLVIGLKSFIATSGFAAITPGQVIMLIVSFVLLYLAIIKQFEPLLLLPIGFGIFLANLPLAGMMAEPVGKLGEQGFQAGGLL